MRKEVKSMKEFSIRIPDVETAKEFCRRAGECDFDVDLVYNKIVIDAKSILGVLSMDLRKTLKVRMNGDNENFEALLMKLHDLAMEAA